MQKRYLQKVTKKIGQKKSLLLRKQKSATWRSVMVKKLLECFMKKSCVATVGLICILYKRTNILSCTIKNGIKYAFSAQQSQPNIA